MQNKTSGFTLIRNGTTFDYPYIESFRSLLPLCDELIINAGIGDDNTMMRVQNFTEREGMKKVSFFKSIWPLHIPEKKRGGQILSEQTNLALDKCAGNWCIYLQADEVIHEEDYPKIRAALKKYENDPKVDGLLFDYVHFYGSYDVYQTSRSAYRREIRAIKKPSGARSIGDAQSFRKEDGTKLNVVHCGARIFHYGWVRPPEAMLKKTVFMDQLYHGDSTGALPHTGDNYRYKKIWGLKRYKGTHPQVMRERIAKKGWKWDLENSPLEWTFHDLKKIVLDFFEKLTGYRLFEYRSYNRIE